jgi:hypothetical protein
MRTAKRLVLAVLFTLALAPCFILAQDSKLAKPEAEVKPQPQPYLLTFTVKESFAGKSAIERSYTLTVLANDDKYHNVSVRDSDRIAEKQVDGGVKNFRVGTNIDVSNLSLRGEFLIVDFRADSEMPVAKSVDGNFPETREWRISVASALVIGKPTVVYSATDAATDHKVEIVLTAKPITDK